MLPYETENIEAVKMNFRKHLDGSASLIKHAIEVIDVWQEKDHVEEPARTAIGLLAQMILRRFRSVVALCELAHFNDADVLCRSLYETFLCERFILMPTLPQAAWSDELEKQFRKLTDLSGTGSISKFTQMSFRADIYFAADPISLNRLHRNLTTPDSTTDDESQQEVSEMINEAKRRLGLKWVDHLQGYNGTYLGFKSVKILSEYYNMTDYYEAPYSLQSHKSHGKGAISIFGGENTDRLPVIIRLAGGLIDLMLNDLDTAFQLGLKQKIEETARHFETATQ